MKTLLVAIFLTTCLVATAGTNFSLFEINPLHGNSQLTATSDSAKTYYGAGNLTGFVEMNGKLFFDAQSTPGDDELWVTDGTLQGTMLVKAINPGHGAAIGNLVYVNNHILFMATDNGTLWDLWSTDGTDTGTVKIDTLNATSNTALGPYNISLIGNSLIFCAQEKLLITDGTPSGTDSLYSLINYSQGFGYCDLANHVYFVLPEIAGDAEIWRTDGTSNGTELVLDLSNTSYNISAAVDLVSFNGEIYLTGIDSGQNSAQLFTFDGSINGQLNRVPIGQSGNAIPSALKLYNGSLYFTATDSVSSNLYRISTDNLTPTALIPNSNFAALSNLTFANNTAYCMQGGGNQIPAVELSGFTYSVLNLQGFHLPNYIYPDAPFLVGLNQLIFIEVYNDTTNQQILMQSDFTGSGTQAIMPAEANTNHPFNSHLNDGIEDIFDLTIWNNMIVAPANFTDAGRELWLLSPAVLSSIDYLQAIKLLSVYPNPAADELTVKTDYCNNCMLQISIADLCGKRILQQNLDGEITTIELSSFASGNYFITLSEDGKNISTKKLVLMK